VCSQSTNHRKRTYFAILINSRIKRLFLHITRTVLTYLPSIHCKVWGQSPRRRRHKCRGAAGIEEFSLDYNVVIFKLRDLTASQLVSIDLSSILPTFNYSIVPQYHAHTHTHICRKNYFVTSRKYCVQIYFVESRYQKNLLK